MSKWLRGKWFAVSLVAALFFGLGIGWVVSRVSKPTVAPSVKELKAVGFVCDPLKKSSDGIMNTSSVCEKNGERLEVSSQPTDQAHDELVRFIVEDMGCPLAHSKDHLGFTLYTRDQMIVYELGRGSTFGALFDDFDARDVACPKKSV
ncbi:MAG: hypothetical protein ACKO3L_02425 [Actinomycetota bacterium]